MNQISGLFETETGGGKSVGSGHKFKLHQILKVPNVTCQEDRERKHHQTWVPLLNSCNSSDSLNSFSRRRSA